MADAKADKARLKELKKAVRAVKDGDMEDVEEFLNEGVLLPNHSEKGQVETHIPHTFIRLKPLSPSRCCLCSSLSQCTP